jgi:hypothetical protein
MCFLRGKMNPEWILHLAEIKKYQQAPKEYEQRYRR